MIPLSVNWSHVWLVTGVGFIMVFILLVVLTWLMQWSGKLFSKIEEKKKVAASKPVKQDAPAVDSVNEEEATDADMAAIAMALHLYYNSVHDVEPTRITIKRVENKGSAWNNKMFGMNNLHR
ncbi:MAG: OadG family protein [Bacteroidaceae bacterium]|nr:OadG family protein [Bacteroidaceae bacterium]